MSLKNWWNNRSREVQVGMIASLFYILPSIFAIIYLMFFKGMQKSIFWLLFVYFPAAFMFRISFLSLIILNHPFLGFILCIIANIIIYFLIGCLIGKLTNLFRKKNKVNPEIKSKKKK